MDFSVYSLIVEGIKAHGLGISSFLLLGSGMIFTTKWITGTLIPKVLEDNSKFFEALREQHGEELQRIEQSHKESMQSIVDKFIVDSRDQREQFKEELREYKNDLRTIREEHRQDRIVLDKVLEEFRNTRKSIDALTKCLLYQGKIAIPRIEGIDESE